MISTADLQSALAWFTENREDLLGWGGSEGFVRVGDAAAGLVQSTDKQHEFLECVRPCAGVAAQNGHACDTQWMLWVMVITGLVYGFSTLSLMMLSFVKLAVQTAGSGDTAMPKFLIVLCLVMYPTMFFMLGVLLAATKCPDNEGPVLKYLGKWFVFQTCALVLYTESVRQARKKHATETAAAAKTNDQHKYVAMT